MTNAIRDIDYICKCYAKAWGDRRRRKEIPIITKGIRLYALDPLLIFSELLIQKQADE